MHKVEIRLTNESDEPGNVFEVYTEALGDKGYAESAPMQTVSGGSVPIVMFLEANERVIVVAKGNLGQLVYDKEQNANVRVETEAQKKERAEREERMAQRQKTDAVVAAQSNANEVQSAAARSTDEAQAAVRRAEREAKAEESKPVVVTPPPPTLNPPVTPPPPPPPKPGAPASVNTDPLDSKQVKT